MLISHHMTLPPQQRSPIPVPADPPVIIRCKTCRVPLPDDTWKNCDRCRRNRTESYRRWKVNVRARQSDASLGPSPLSSTQPLSAPTVIPPTLPSSVASSVAAASSNAPPPPHHRSTWRVHVPAIGGSQTTTANNQPRPRGTPASTSTSASASNRPTERHPIIHVPEFQSSDELVDKLSALPPGSNFLGKFSVVADPAVDNPKRAQMFADKLRVEGVPILCVILFSCSTHHSPLSHNFSLLFFFFTYARG
jgi:hypothetical protein